MNSLRIGAGAGYSGDRIAPALDLIERGSLDYIVFECLAERTIALAQQAKNLNNDLGYDPLLEARMRQVLPACHRHRTRLISNMGAANPRAASAKTQQIAENLGLKGLKIAAITGDDVLPLFAAGEYRDAELLETGELVSSLGEKLLSANAYIGAEPIVQALDAGADIVLGGRIADPSLFLAPLVHTFGWDPRNWDQLAAGILVGHLLECAGQLTGGYFADPPWKNVPDLAHLGFPYADVQRDGTAEFGKLSDTGGLLSVATCKEQLLYEIHDPSRYVTPDVTSDFSNVHLEQLAPNCVRATKAVGTERPHRLKVSLGYSDGYIGEGQITYAGSGATDRARLAIEIVKEQLHVSAGNLRELRCEMIGFNSVGIDRNHGGPPAEVRVRVAGRADSAEDANCVSAAVEALYTNGPAAGGGVFRSVRPVVAIASTFIPRDRIQFDLDYLVTR